MEREGKRERASEREREDGGRGRETEIKRERMRAFETVPTLVHAHTCTCVFSNGESSLRAVSPANSPLLSSPLLSDERNPSRLYSTRASARHRFFPPAPPPPSPAVVLSPMSAAATTTTTTLTIVLVIARTQGGYALSPSDRVRQSSRNAPECPDLSN